MTHITPELKDQRKTQATYIVAKILNRRVPGRYDKWAVAEEIIEALESAGYLRLLTATVKKGDDR